LDELRRQVRWVPILNSDAREQASRAIRQISTEVSSSDKMLLPATKLAERALLFHYLANSEIFEPPMCVQDLLDLATDNITSDISPALHGGLSGIGWIVQHLMSSNEIDQSSTAEAGSEPDVLCEIDSFLRLACEANKVRQYDLISGLVGVGLYFLERPLTEDTRLGLATIVRQLDEKAEKIGNGYALWTSPEMLSDFESSLCPGGYYGRAT
jgi:hypothetical protein